MAIFKKEKMIISYYPNKGQDILKGIMISPKLKPEDFLGALFYNANTKYYSTILNLEVKNDKYVMHISNEAFYYYPKTGLFKVPTYEK